MNAPTEMLLEQMCKTPEAAERLLAQAISSARRLAESGNFAQVRMLAGLLFIRAQMLEDEATFFPDIDGQTGREKALVLAEALALLDRSADEGDEIAENCLFTATHLGLSAEAFRLASEFRPSLAPQRNHAIHVPCRRCSGSPFSNHSRRLFSRSFGH